MAGLWRIEAAALKSALGPGLGPRSGGRAAFGVPSQPHRQPLGSPEVLDPRERSAVRSTGGIRQGHSAHATLVYRTRARTSHLGTGLV
ncbi:unnamed protein product [Clonostachys byssicola]|uniref:Uncharacterized protein n=1 Tax=Clonostachys byssicola TaxID=160290 RepID=A0A9N9Y7B4_9HYPO|nr:unnamed protein product [Clonostachys byssicola]